MKKEELIACDEYRTLSRRSLLGSSLVAATLPSWFPQVAFAKNGEIGDRDILIVVNLRGGSDGLSFCCPHGDPAYYASRPSLAVRQPDQGINGAIDIDGYFGFPQAFASFMDPFQSGHMSVIHAAGREKWSFSHFDAARWMEQGISGPSIGSGWLARHLRSSNEMVSDAEIRVMNLSEVKPIVLHGSERVYSASDPSKTKYGGSFPHFDTQAVQDIYLRQYSRLMDSTRIAVRDGVRAISLVNNLQLANYTPVSSVVYDETPFGTSMRATSSLIKARVGIEVFHTEIKGWDTHVEQGTNDGALNTKMRDLSRNITNLYRDLMNDGITNWTLVVISEFGRRINENGGNGTEHGEGNTMLVVSPNLKASAGGKVLADWPGIRVEDRTRHDGLRPTTDDRDVWAEIIRKRLKNTNTPYIFPNYSPVKKDLLFDAA